MKEIIINNHNSIRQDLLNYFERYSQNIQMGFRDIFDNKIKINSQGKSENQKRTELISEALSLIGIPYRYGGNSKNGIDCSAFVRRVYRSQGILLPRTARSQFEASRDYAVINPSPGDVVYFRKNTKSNKITHVGIVLADGRFIHASEGKKSVIISSMWDSIYKTRIAGYRRFL